MVEGEGGGWCGGGDGYGGAGEEEREAGESDGEGEGELQSAGVVGPECMKGLECLKCMMRAKCMKSARFEYMVGSQTDDRTADADVQEPSKGALSTLTSALTGRRGLTSDAGWGCMLRTGQSLLANALVVAWMGRGA